MLGDSVTTDHISPAGSIKADSPAGRYLAEHGVERKDFNSYGSRRGNHEVMIRGTFANIRLRNQLLDGVEGGFTRNFTRGRRADDDLRRRAGLRRRGRPARHPRRQGVRLRVQPGLGGQGHRAARASGRSSRSRYERIHRSNLIGMGVLPLQFPAGESAARCGLDGRGDVRDHRGRRRSTTGRRRARSRSPRSPSDGAHRAVRRRRPDRHPRRGGLLPQRRDPAVRAAAARPRLIAEERSGAEPTAPRDVRLSQVTGIES